MLDYICVFLPHHYFYTCMVTMEQRQFNIPGFCLQNLCRELHQKIDVADEERYDINAKVKKNDVEVSNMCTVKQRHSFTS